MKTDKAVYGLYLSKDSDIKTERDYDGRATGHAELSIVKVENGVITNDTYGPFHDLTFYCQWNEKMDEGKPFAWQVEFRHVFTVDMVTAERMLKVLRKANAAKLPVQPTSFGQYCVLMARHLGIKKFVVCRNRNASSSYADMDHNVYEISEGQYMIDRAIAEAYEKQVPQNNGASEVCA